MDFLQLIDSPAQSYTFAEFQLDFQYNQLGDCWSITVWKESILLIGGRIITPGFDLLDGIPDADRLAELDDNAPATYTLTPRSIDSNQTPISGTCLSPQTRVIVAFRLPGVQANEDQYSALLQTESLFLVATTRGELSQLLLER